MLSCWCVREAMPRRIDHSSISPPRRSCYSVLSTFLSALIERSRRFKDELLASAMDLLLCAPLRFVSAHMPPMITSLESAFAMGHAYRPLAITALGALESWLDSLRAALRPHLSSLLPCLHVYLTLSADKQARMGKTRTVRDSRRSGGGTQSVLKNSARTRLKRGGDEELQLRIVRVLGRVGGDCVGIVQGNGRTAQGEGGRWSLDDLADFPMRFDGECDMRVPPCPSLPPAHPHPCTLTSPWHVMRR